MTYFQILDHIPGNTGCTTYDPGDTKDSHNAMITCNSDGYQQKSGDQKG